MGYVPGPNDRDLLKPEDLNPGEKEDDNGRCHRLGYCLSKEQWNASFHAEFLFNNSSDVTVSGLSGKYYAITFTDSSNVRVVNSQVHGGRSFGGIAFWRNSSGTPGCSNVIVHGNDIQFTTFSGVILGGATNALVSDNSIAYVGESGIKTAQRNGATGPSFVQSSHIEVSRNTVQYSWCDGLDLSSTAPRKGEFDAYYSVSGNSSAFNHRTGIYGEGRYCRYADNEFYSNGLTAMALDVLYSTIDHNRITDSDTRNVAGEHQILFGQGIVTFGNNVFQNVIENPNRNVGQCIYTYGSLAATGGVNQICQNTCVGASIWNANGFDYVHDNYESF